MDVPSVWIAKLYISQRTEQKINQLHRLTADEIRTAVVCVRGLQGRARWNGHHEDMATHRDFYEDDEPIEEILAAREAGAPFVTEPPLMV